MLRAKSWCKKPKRLEKRVFTPTVISTGSYALLITAMANIYSPHLGLRTR